MSHISYIYIAAGRYWMGKRNVWLVSCLCICKPLSSRCLGWETEVMLVAEGAFPEMSSALGWVCSIYSSGCCLGNLSTCPACEYRNSAELKDWKQKDLSGTDFAMLCLKVRLMGGKHVISMLVTRSVPKRTTSPWHFSAWMECSFIPNHTGITSI